MMRLLPISAVAVSLLVAGCANQHNAPGRADSKTALVATTTATPASTKKARNERPMAPPLTGGIWLNTDKPLSLEQLRGHIVILDFWTYCCINCMHILPELKRVEERFKGKPVVVIGVHSGKFDAEKDPARIREAIGRYDIRHPVVVDSRFEIWQRYGINAWPTLAIIDAEGRVLGISPGEPKRGVLGEVIDVLLQRAAKQGVLAKKPIEIRTPKPVATGPLAYPGKVAVAPNGDIAIADSNHHRIVIVDKRGTRLAVAGSGIQGSADGSFDEAAFNRPQGLAFGPGGHTLYVADTENHQLRLLDRRAGTVTTLAGTGRKAESLGSGGPGRVTALRSPWDVAVHGDQVYVAMAGAHQIWRYDTRDKTIKVFAGSGRESIVDGELAEAAFSQPSGLSLRGNVLYVADSEVSAVRAIDLGAAKVRTIVGTGLFDFGDVDGAGKKVRLQHALGVVAVNGTLYVADTYNNKLKRLDPRSKRATTLVGGEKVFREPGGLAVMPDGKLLVADTNNHRLRVVDPKTRRVTTLALRGVTAPAAAGLVMAAAPRTTAPKLPVRKVKATGALGLGKAVVDFMPQPPIIGKLAPGSPIVIRSRSMRGGVRFTKKVRAELNPFKLPVAIPVEVSGTGRSARAELDVTFYWCRKDGSACLPERVRLDVELRIDPTAKGGHATVSHRVGSR